MHQVQLVEYAQHSQKISPYNLSQNDEKKNVPIWKVLFAHFVDFWFTFLAGTFMATLLNEFFKTMLVTRTLRKSFSSFETINLMTTLLPLLVVGYFFFSYFFNHGQTYGMHLMKLRVQMKSMSFKEAFKWSLQSMSFCFTAGVSSIFFKDVWKSFRNHDYLYEELMTFRPNNQINVVNRTEELDVKKWDTIIEKEAA